MAPAYAWPPSWRSRALLLHTQPQTQLEWVTVLHPWSTNKSTAVASAATAAVLQVVGFDMVDDESKPERRPTKHSPLPQVSKTCPHVQDQHRAATCSKGCVLTAPWMAQSATLSAQAAQDTLPPSARQRHSG
jgi:hypothetical protein